jgi:hypothetical protein
MATFTFKDSLVLSVYYKTYSVGSNYSGKSDGENSINVTAWVAGINQEKANTAQFPRIRTRALGE